ncbi:DUF393 domain-containing protein [Vibrio sp. Of7-15]|uniref:thiol-disulfide oxidoreductase DCC family protein n=1 Tax=Vibrio sp. Of7-15 TaxID=2724879 RepID=UPI001EF229D8|nr:DUF393 domain-containing protein [Vibrio sp. Of7-15]MCG7495477.1 DUF393 domain-containing protein [Vibrio sp. Of7-15]
MEREANRVTVFYDGSCPRCVKDREQYEKLAGKHAETVEWFDITHQDEHLKSLGIEPSKALTELHVRTKEGKVVSELDAYITLMEPVLVLKPIAWCLRLPIIKPMLSRWYRRSVIKRLKREGRLPTHL